MLLDFDPELRVKLDGIEQAMSDLQAKLKDVCKSHHDINDSHTGSLDLTAFKYFVDELEGFRHDDLVPTMETNDEAKPDEPYDNDNPGYLSQEQMGIAS